MNPSETNEKIALAWIEAFNEHNLEKLLQLYDEQAVHFSPKLKIRKPETNGLIKGKPSLRDWWQDAFNRLPTLQYQLQNLLTDKEQVLMEYQRNVSGEPVMMVAEILEIENELIVKSRVYHG